MTTFSHGCAANFFVQGKKVSESYENGWFNLNVQSQMPCLSIENSELLEWSFDEAFYGGSCVLVKPGSEMQRLFDFNLSLQANHGYVLEYAFKIGDESDSQRFYAVLSYKNGAKNLALNGDRLENEDFEISLRQDTNKSWHRRTYALKVKSDDVKLTALCVVNQLDVSVKLGLVRLLDESSEPKSFLKPRTEFRTKLFNLNKRTFLCVDLDWTKFDENFKYYNVFIDEHHESSAKTEVKLRLVGSTKIEHFSVCLRINKRFGMDSVAFSIEPKLKFSIYVQSIDKNLDNLTIEDSFSTSNGTFIEIKVAAKGLMPCDDDLTKFDFFDEIIYDFETFE